MNTQTILSNFETKTPGFDQLINIPTYGELNLFIFPIGNQYFDVD